MSVSGKKTGRGDEEQIQVELTATALCINNGGNHRKAVNKASVSAAGDFPVQNGKADFTLSATAVFEPDGSPTMSDVRLTVTDITNGRRDFSSATRRAAPTWTPDGPLDRLRQRPRVLREGRGGHASFRAEER